MQETLRGHGEQIITKLLWLHKIFMMFLSFPVSSLGVNSALFVKVTGASSLHIDLSLCIIIRCDSEQPRSRCMQACVPVDTGTNIPPVLQAGFHQTNWFGGDVSPVSA